jgi:hypothetical protein
MRNRQMAMLDAIGAEVDLGGNPTAQVRRGFDHPASSSFS